MIVVLMGVSGAGKTTIGKALAASIGCDFLDGDDWHPPANVAKMAAGHPLELRIQPGYDHSYYFIASFIGDHIAHHAAALKA